MARKDAMTSKLETMTSPMETAEFTAFSPTETAEFAAVVPTDEQVRFRAHEIYRARCHNGGNGDALADWIAAERELRAVGKAR